MAEGRKGPQRIILVGDYTEHSFGLIGDTFPIKGELKDRDFKFVNNPSKLGPVWWASRNILGKTREFLQSLDVEVEEMTLEEAIEARKTRPRPAAKKGTIGTPTGETEAEAWMSVPGTHYLLQIDPFSGIVDRPPMEIENLLTDVPEDGHWIHVVIDWENIFPKDAKFAFVFAAWPKSGPERNWVHADVRFTGSDAFDSFKRYFGMYKYSTAHYDRVKNDARRISKESTERWTQQYKTDINERSLFLLNPEAGITKGGLVFWVMPIN